MVNYLSKRHLFVWLAVAGLCMVILTCGTRCASPPEDQITIIDKKEAQGEAIVEELLANNCAGTSELTQDLRAVKQFSHDVQVEPYPGVSVNKQAVENEIRSTYKIAKEHGEQICIVPVQVPAGMFYAYDLEWREVWREGEFELGSPDEKPEGNYRFMQGVLCEVVGQKVKTCQ
jgi:hypothetical protein